MKSKDGFVQAYNAQAAVLDATLFRRLRDPFTVSEERRL
jgi:hypothetical protein